MRDLLQYTMFQGIGGSTTIAIVQAAVVLGLFAIFLFKHELIRSTTFFRWASTLLAFSIILPPAFWMVVVALLEDASPRGSSPLIFMLPSILGPVLVGLSIICAFAALGPAAKPPLPQAPVKHPLD